MHGSRRPKSLREWAEKYDFVRAPLSPSCCVASVCVLSAGDGRSSNLILSVADGMCNVVWQSLPNDGK